MFSSHWVWNNLLLQNWHFYILCVPVVFLRLFRALTAKISSLIVWRPQIGERFNILAATSENIPLDICANSLIGALWWNKAKGPMLIWCQNTRKQQAEPWWTRLQTLKTYVNQFLSSARQKEHWQTVFTICRRRSDAAECSVWSEATLLALKYSNVFKAWQ